MITKFTVKKSEWLRGAKNFSRLLNSEGKRCCLGFLGQASGISDKSMLNAVSPIDMYNARIGGWNLWSDFLLDITGGDNSRSCCLIMRFNDEPDIEDSVREELLKKEFKNHGVEIIFEE